MSDDQKIGFQDPDEGEMPSEMKDHWIAAFKHEAGLGPHPGAYTGPPRRRRDPDEITDADRQSAEEEPLEDQDRPHEAGYRKMKAAQTGGSGLGLGPPPMEQKAAEQQGAISQAAGAQGAAAAVQAQGAQVPTAPPPAPSGSLGVTEPYEAERGETPPGIPEAPGKGK